MSNVSLLITPGVSRYFFRAISCRIRPIVMFTFTYTVTSAVEKCLKPDGNKSCYVIFKINLKSNP